MFDTTMSPRRKAFDRALDAFARLERTRYDATAEHAQRAASVAVVVVLVASALALVFGLLLALSTARRLSGYYAASTSAELVASARRRYASLSPMTGRPSHPTG